MCDIAPFSMECVHEEYQYELAGCLVNHLGCASRELFKSIPIIGKYVSTYQCSMFCPRMDGDGQ